MAAVVQIVGAATGAPTPYDGRFVVSWNPNTRFGYCDVETTDDRAKARRFASSLEAFEEWRTVSTVQPRRPTDGEPNRPLAGLSISIETDPPPTRRPR